MTPYLVIHKLYMKLNNNSPVRISVRGGTFLKSNFKGDPKTEILNVALQ